ncbi:MAG: HEAT repeat domain-containing protein [bacterium]|nr:HEAT repeat domain-containing protein [bacterium]
MIIKELRVALSNILLYPPDSEIIKQSLENCSADILNFLKLQSSLTISESEGKLLVNDKSTETAGGIFFDCLVACKIRSITFKLGFTQQELYNFLHKLSLKQKPEPSEHISINEKLYVPMGDNDIIIAKGQDLLGIKDKVLLYADEIAKLIDKVEDSGIKSDLKNKVVEKLGTEVFSNKVETQVVADKRTIPDKLEIKDFLDMDNKDMIEEELLNKLPSLLESLRSPEELEQASDLCNKLASNLEASVTDIRLKAIIAFKKLYSVIEFIREPKIIKDIDKKFVEAGRKETNGEIYKEIVNILGNAATRYLKQGDYASTHMITEMLGAHASSTEFDERRESAKSTIDSLIGTEFTRLLVYDLHSDDESRREKAISILLDIGDSCIKPLIAELKEVTDIRLRKAIADILMKIGESGITQLMEEIKVEPLPIAISKMLDVLDGIGYEEQVVDGLKKIVHHPNFYVRRKVVDILYKIGTESAKQLLFEEINDEISAIKERVITYLGELHYFPLAVKLIEILDKHKDEKETVQICACKALIELGDASSTPVLLKVAMPGSMFRQARPREVRMAAIEALIMLGDKRVHQFMNDKDKVVQRFVRELIGNKQDK